MKEEWVGNGGGRDGGGGKQQREDKEGSVSQWADADDGTGAPFGPATSKLAALTSDHVSGGRKILDDVGGRAREFCQPLGAWRERLSSSAIAPVLHPRQKGLESSTRTALQISNTCRCPS